jgi:site-specific DNA-methyltransferase (adenine-specific)
MATPKGPDFSKNLLFFGDNLDVLRKWVKDETADLIYLDPPFNSKRDYNLIFGNGASGPSADQVHAFEDSWSWGAASEEAYQYLTESAVHGGAVPTSVSRIIGALRDGLGENDVTAYLVMMTVRLVELHRVLKPTGSIYLHCDPAASHYLKVVMDAIFGARNFRREIIWRSGWVSGFKSRAKNWVRNHDVILYYVKIEKASYVFNKDAAYKPHDAGYKRRGGGENPKGVAIDDVWDEVALYSPWIKSFSTEKLGYPTQKPLALLERLIAASSNEGDVVLDPFCGCGTAVDAAQRLGRRWIGIDVSYLAVDLIETRLLDTYGAGITSTFEVVGVPRDTEGAQALFKRSPFDFERWAVSLIDGTPNEKQVGDRGVDGVVRFPVSSANDVGRIIVSVKGGTLNPSMVRDLAGTVEAQKASMGVLISNQPITKGMAEAAQHSGTYTHPLTGTTYPKVQLATVADLLAGRKPKMPTAFMPYLQAAKFIPDHPTLPGL